MQLGAIDRMLMQIAPGFVAKRLINRAACAALADSEDDWHGYESGGTSRFRDAHWLGRSRQLDEDHQIGADGRRRTRLQLRDIRRNFGIVNSFMERFAQNVLWGGITLELETDDAEFNAEAEAFAKDWMTTCDSRSRDDFEGLCRTVIQSRPFDGHGGFVKLANGQLQPIEGERICTPDGSKNKRIIDGVQMDRTGRIEGVWIAPRTDAGTLDRKRCEFVEAADFILWANHEHRMDSVLGAPDLAPIAGDLEDARKLQLYTVNKAKLDQLQAWAVLTESGGIPKNLVSRHESLGRTSDEPVEQKTNHGTFWWMKRGDDVKSLRSETPNAQYEGFYALILRMISAGMSVPPEFFLLDFRGLSWSTAKAVIQSAGNTVTGRHEWLVKKVVKPSISFALMKGIETRQIRRPPVESNGKSQLFRMRFNVPGYQWIQEAEYYDGKKAGWNMAITNLDEIARQKGKTRDQLLDAKNADIEAAIIRAKALSEKHGVAVSWEQYINAGVPGVTFQPQPKPEEGDTK
jgi:hypothetical protein